ncbi:MAG: hypothetical protein B6D44_00815 [Ignavibacteriales bacterium UTCHB2]|nr:MAG: hypothetical protein B6D44_00815 [Ignavibacteriales bacterium UTCHB2]
MNTGEQLFAIGALLLLSLSIVRINNNILLTDSILIDSKHGIIANSIATSLIESATEKFYDANTKEGPCLLSALTYPPKPESGETHPNDFNDFDDFNNYTQNDTVGSVVFYSKCKVAYVKPNPNAPTSLNVNVSERTWNKKLTVSVTWKQNDQTIGFTPDTIKQSTIYSYWYF